MNPPRPHSVFADRLGAFVAFALVVNMTWATVAPYFITIPEVAVRLVDQQQNFLWAALMLLFGFLWGNSSGNRAKDGIIATQAETTKAMQSAGSPPVDATITLAPNETATVTAAPEPEKE